MQITLFLSDTIIFGGVQWLTLLTRMSFVQSNSQNLIAIPQNGYN
jgi:hypothetical protein